MKKNTAITAVSCFLFVCFLATGLTIARYKRLWNDEIYSQISSIENYSYVDILRGGIEEGNVCPLFYLSQKAFLGSIGYISPPVWKEGDKAAWKTSLPFDRLVLRVNSVVFMSLSLVLTFAYFARVYSWGAGALSLFLAMTTAMTWAYWAEARPYSLWVLLTTAQALIFLHGTRDREWYARHWQRLAAVHYLLAFTFIFSAPQVVIVSVLLWFFADRSPSRLRILALYPVVVMAIYYFYSPKFKFWVEQSVEQYVRDNISRDRLYVLMLFLISMLVYAGERVLGKVRVFRDRTLAAGGPFLLLMLGMIAAVAAIVVVFHLRSSGEKAGFVVTGRYFINLMPLGVVGTTVFMVLLWRAFKEWFWLRTALALGVGWLFAHRALEVGRSMLEHYHKMMGAG